MISYQGFLNVSIYKNYFYLYISLLCHGHITGRMQYYAKCQISFCIEK
jgi:hypothetical protein